MNSKKSKKLLAKARASKKVKNGLMTGDELYLVLKKQEKAKKKKQVVKQKISPRQKRLLAQRESLTTIQLRGRSKATGREQAPKDKAHKF